MILTVNFKCLTLLLVAVAIYLLWMDVGFYLEVQQLPVRVSNNSESEAGFVYSPFGPITVKLLMLSATIQFIDEPLAYLTVYYTRVAEYFSPNAVSLLGVLVAAIAAKFFVNEELKYRQFGVLLFKIRDYIDGLDGSVFRERSQSHFKGHVANPSSFGWMMDGLCDGFGDLFRLIAFVIVLQRFLNSNGNKNVGYQYQLMSDLESSICQKHKAEPIQKPSLRGRVWRLWLIYRRPLIIMVCIGLQALISSVLWNYFMINYHMILETDVGPQANLQAVLGTQNSIMRSSGMWMVCYFWRLVNPQNVTQLQLLAILYNKESELLLTSQLLGFVPPLVVALGSYIHLQYAAAAVHAAAFL